MIEPAISSYFYFSSLVIQLSTISCGIYSHILRKTKRIGRQILLGPPNVQFRPAVDALEKRPCRFIAVGEATRKQKQ